MISREQSLELRKTYLDDDESPIEMVPLREILDTLDAALKVVEAAKVVRYWEVAFEQKTPDGEVKFLIDQKDGLKLLEALAPFTAPRGKE